MKKSPHPRTDKAADYTAPEKMHKLCRQLERKTIAQTKAIRQILKAFPDLEDWERGNGVSLRPLAKRLRRLSSANALDQIREE
jgi:hypothetical protein